MKKKQAEKENLEEEVQRIKQLLKYIKLGPLNAHPEWRKILNTSNNKEVFTDFFLNEIK